MADTHTSSLGRLSASTEPCALSYATHPHTPRNARSTSRTYNNRWCKSRYDQYGSQIAYSASIITKVGSTRRGTARPTGLVNGVVKVVARRWQRTASGGRQLLAPMGVVVYFVACFVRVANATINRSTLKPFYVTGNTSIYGVLCGISSRVQKWRTDHGSKQMKVLTVGYSVVQRCT